MALAEKGIAYTHEPVAPHSVEVLALNPFGRVPAFRDGEFTLYETSAIVRYIEESFPGPSLLAGNARLRATMEQWVSLINCHAYDAMVRRYVLQYVFPKGANGAPDRAVIDAPCRRSRPTSRSSTELTVRATYWWATPCRWPICCSRRSSSISGCSRRARHCLPARRM